MFLSADLSLFDMHKTMCPVTVRKSVEELEASKRTNLLLDLWKKNELIRFQKMDLLDCDFYMPNNVKYSYGQLCNTLTTGCKEKNHANSTQEHPEGN
jgi:hypothetical protein